MDACGIDIRVEEAGDAVVVVSPAGILDSGSYLALRNGVVKAATESPTVVVCVDELVVPSVSAWAVLTSAQWMVSTWPGASVCVVATLSSVHTDLVANGITRYVALYDSLEAAVSAAAGRGPEHPRRRAVLQLPRHSAAHGVAREFIRRTLAEWCRPELSLSAEPIAFEFVSNVLAHTASAPRLRLELKGDALTVAVADNSTDPAVREEPTGGTQRFSGLGVVSSLARTWGSHPTMEGKVVWAVVVSRGQRSSRTRAASRLIG